jgi:glutathione S-transferase
MIQLHSFGSNLGVIDPSPFVLKVDAYMRMAGIEFEHVATLNNLKKAPKGKLPFITDKGKTIGDSQLIIEHFQQQTEHDLNAHLNPQQKAICYLTTKSLDENLYFILVYSRWLSDDTWPIIKDAFFKEMPAPLKLIVPNMLRKGVKKGLTGQGMARHSPEELQHMMRKNMQALSDLLGDNNYFFNQQPCSLDATVYAFLSAFISVSIVNPFNEIAREFDNLTRYCKRIDQRFYDEPVADLELKD